MCELLGDRLRMTTCTCSASRDPFGQVRVEPGRLAGKGAL